MTPEQQKAKEFLKGYRWAAPVYEVLDDYAREEKIKLLEGLSAEILTIATNGLQDKGLLFGLDLGRTVLQRELSKLKERL